MGMDEKRKELRREVLARCGATAATEGELLEYTENVFRHESLEQLPPFPLPDEPHVQVWERYAEDSEDRGAVTALSERLVQLMFPVREGMSGETDYLAATRRGVFPVPGHSSHGSLKFADPSGIRLVIHHTMAGRVPLLIAETREDFELLVQAFTERNEPVTVPRSMGACIVRGLNNWDRIRSYRRSWQMLNPGAPDESWKEEFRKLIPHKELYQDGFIILSSGDYSGVSAEVAGVPESHWRPLSLRLRLEHESTHYFTFRVLGAMRNNVLDELVADYVALIRVFNRYDTRLARNFFGLEDFPSYRQGGRLENYRGSLSDAAFDVVKRLVNDAIERVGEFEASIDSESRDELVLVDTVLALTSMTLEEIADGRLREAFEDVRSMRLRSQVRRTSMHDEMLLKIGDMETGVDEVIDGFRAFSNKHTLPDKMVASINLALDEIVSNIIKYGYDESQTSREIEVRFAVDDGVLTTEIVDNARAFNILEMEDPDVTLSVDERPIGGLGVYLVRKLTDEQMYERVDGRNHLTLRKRLE